MLINQDAQWNDSTESELQQTFPDFEVMGVCYIFKMTFHSFFFVCNYTYIVCGIVYNDIVHRFYILHK